MRIALYYPWICLKGGVERTILEIVKNKSHDYTLFTNRFDKKNTFSEFKNVSVVELHKIPERINIISNIFGALVILFQKIDLSGFDLFMIHSEGIANLVTFRNKGIPIMLFCYTPLRPVYDSYHASHIFQQKNIFVQKIMFILSNIFKAIDKKLWKNFQYIVFISKESMLRANKANIISSKSKTTIINPGSDWANIMPSNKFEKFFLLPGRITWSKNIELAIEAFSLFNAKSKYKEKFKLIIAGGLNKKNQEYFNKIKLLIKSNKNILLIPNPTERYLRNLYSKCYATVAVAPHEDWGLTPIEGNAFGKPSICLDSGGYKESQINGVTGYLVKASPKSVSKAMQKIADDIKSVKKMGHNSRLISKKYSWASFNLTLDSFIIKSVD